MEILNRFFAPALMASCGGMMAQSPGGLPRTASATAQWQARCDLEPAGMSAEMLEVMEMRRPPHGGTRRRSWVSAMFTEAELRTIARFFSRQQ
jgi:hypothetical protein